MIVDVGEGDDLPALLGDGQLRDQRVILAVDQAGDHAVPGCVEDVAVELGGIADRLHQLDVVADQLAVGIDGFERREGGVGGDVDLAVGGGHRAGEGGERQGEAKPLDHGLHGFGPSGLLWLLAQSSWCPVGPDQCFSRPARNC